MKNKFDIEEFNRISSIVVFVYMYAIFKDTFNGGKLDDDSDNNEY